jgi:hypothetical protein
MKLTMKPNFISLTPYCADITIIPSCFILGHKRKEKAGKMKKITSVSQKEKIYKYELDDSNKYLLINVDLLPIV